MGKRDSVEGRIVEINLSDDYCLPYCEHGGRNRMTTLLAADLQTFGLHRSRFPGVSSEEYLPEFIVFLPSLLQTTQTCQSQLNDTYCPPS